QVAKLLVARAALEVLVSLNAVELFGYLPVMFPPCGVNVADRDHLGIGHRQKVVQEPATLRARANDAHSDAVVGAFPGRGAASGVEEKRRRQRGDRSCFEELASIQLVLHGAVQCLLHSTPGQSNSSDELKRAADSPAPLVMRA